MTEPTITNAADSSRYEAHVDGTLAGFAEYQLTDRLIVFTHTEVKPDFEGQGVASAIARFALDDVRADGRREALPLCSFIKGWIARHADYRDLVYGADRPAPSDAND